MIKYTDNMILDTANNTISFNDTTATAVYFDVTDGDMMIGAVQGTDASLALFAKYAYFREQYPDGGVFNSGGSSVAYRSSLIYDIEIENWAMHLVMDVYSYLGTIIEEIIFYPGGSFKLRCKYYE